VVKKEAVDTEIARMKRKIMLDFIEEYKSLFCKASDNYKFHVNQMN
jgi:hypothetical protein